jgi:hypothetical protein
MEEASRDQEIESDERRNVDTPSNMAETMRILKEKLQIYRTDNERLIQAQEQQNELNVVLLQSLSEIQKHLHQGPTMRNVGRISSKKRHQGTRE